MTIYKGTIKTRNFKKEIILMKRIIRYIRTKIEKSQKPTLRLYIYSECIVTKCKTSKSLQLCLFDKRQTTLLGVDFLVSNLN